MRLVYLIVIALLLAPVFVSAQGGFGGFSYRFEKFDGSNLMMIGGGGAWVLNEHFYLGGSGFMSVNNVSIEDQTLEGMGFGGAMIGFLRPINKNLKIGAQAMVGSGGYTLDQMAYRFWFVEPQLSIWYKINPFMYFNLGVNYRQGFVNDSDPLDQKTLNNPSLQFSLYFGSF